MLLKKRYITERPFDNPTQIIREEPPKKVTVVKEIIAIQGSDKEVSSARKKSKVKSLYIKKVNLVVKVK